MRTSFHHQPEAQHPNSSAIHKLVGRLTHLLGVKRTSHRRRERGDPTRLTPSGHCSCGATSGFPRLSEREDRLLAAWYRSSHEAALAQRGLIRKQGGSDEEMDCT
jgi:hypothetical protein